MTQAEIRRFVRAYQKLADDGVMDAFVAAHDDMSQQQHEISPNVMTLSFHFMPQPGGERFLPWHRAFLLELENKLREAVRAQEGNASAASFALPYWDFSSGGLPDWVRSFLPKRIKAKRPAELPPGHPGYGYAPGAMYEMVVSRWPGMYAVARVLPQPQHIGQLMTEPDYTKFTRKLEWAPLARTNGRVDSAKVSALIDQIAAVQTVDDSVPLLGQFAIEEKLPPEAWQKVFNAMARVGQHASGATRLPEPVRMQFEKIGSLISELYLLGPHTLAHAWAAGYAPGRPLVKGTPLYFHETAGDPLFWMLHANVDRIWFSWMLRYADRPALSGADTMFTPVPGGSTYTLAQMLDFRALPYAYDRIV
jgi:hypothetical protein